MGHQYYIVYNCIYIFEALILIQYVFNSFKYINYCYLTSDSDFLKVEYFVKVLLIKEPFPKYFVFMILIRNHSLATWKTLT